MKQVGQLIRINERGAARVLSGKAGMMFVVENWVGVDSRCAAVLDYRYPDASMVGGFQCWTIEPEGFEIVREAPAPTAAETRLKIALARLTDSFLEKHGCFPLDNQKWKAAMTEAYVLIGQPNTPARTAALAEISSEAPATVLIDGNEIWEALMSICKGDVPDGMDEAVCDELAASMNRVFANPVCNLFAPQGWFLHSAEHRHTGIVFRGDTHQPLPHAEGSWLVQFQRYPTGGALARGYGHSLAEAWANAAVETQEKTVG